MLTFIGYYGIWGRCIFFSVFIMLLAIFYVIHYFHVVFYAPFFACFLFSILLIRPSSWFISFRRATGFVCPAPFAGNDGLQRPLPHILRDASETCPSRSPTYPHRSIPLSETLLAPDISAGGFGQSGRWRATAVKAAISSTAFAWFSNGCRPARPSSRPHGKAAFAHSRPKLRGHPSCWSPSTHTMPAIPSLGAISAPDWCFPDQDRRGPRLVAGFIASSNRLGGGAECGGYSTGKDFVLIKDRQVSCLWISVGDNKASRRRISPR